MNGRRAIQLARWAARLMVAKAVSADFTCQFCAFLFDRIMRIAYSLIRGHDPRVRMDQAFTGNTLRDDMRRLLPEPEYPKAEAASIMKRNQAFDEFTMTGMRPVRDARRIVLRKPRMLYATEMLQTLTPHGPFEHFDRRKIAAKNPDKIAFVRDCERPCMVELTVERMAPEIAPVYGFGNTADRDRRSQRSWVAHPEFHVLQRLAEIDVRSVYMGREYGALAASLPENVKEFLADKHNEFSWSAGIVAEAIWRAATLSEEKSKVGVLREGEDRADTSWQGAWIKAADKISMFLTAHEITQAGHSVSSYGIGWVQCMVPEESLKDLINDGLSLGLLPSMLDLPDVMFSADVPVHWGWDNRSHGLAHFVASKRQNLLWNLDRVPTLKPDQRGKFISDLMAQTRQKQI